MVSLTLARGEVPVMLALRLFLPESWTSDRARLERTGVPAEYRTARTKPEIALAEIDRVIAAGVRFGCVLTDAGSARPYHHRSSLAIDHPDCAAQLASLPLRRRARRAFMIRSGHAKQAQSHRTTGSANHELCRVEGPC
jgi:hypothetical protein